MPSAIPAHVAFFYTGIPSYAAALRLGQGFGKTLGLRRSSQNRILADLRTLHGEWTKAGSKGLKSVTVLGVLVPDALEQDRSLHPGELEGMLEAWNRAGVKVHLLNEYKPFAAPELAGAVLRGELHKRGCSLVQAVEDLHGLAPEDPLKLAETVGKDAPPTDLVQALEWVDTELKQFPEETGALEELVQDLSGARSLPPKWQGRARIQPRRGKALLAGRIYEPVVKEAMRVAPSDLPVLILGPSGSGKEALARRIHFASPRAEHRLLMESCANFPDTLIEAELFGTSAGAFTGAVERAGLLKEADGGTLFLDELGELSRPAQGKLLRFLQEGTFRPVGGRTDLKVDVRLVAATNEDLYAKMREGSFRADLWYRLAGAVLETPALCGHPDSAVSLRRIAGHQAVVLFDEDPKLREQREKAGHPLRLEESQVGALLGYDWPGNVRELRQAVHRHLVTGIPMAEVVEELRRREKRWQERKGREEEETFKVRGLPTLDKLKEDYCLWVSEKHPEWTQQEVADAVGQTVKPVREKLRRARTRKT